MPLSDSNPGKYEAQRQKKLKKKKKKVTSAQQNAQGRGGVAPANYNPKISAPKPPRQPKPKPSVKLPHVPLVDFQHEDPMEANAKNMTRAWMDKYKTRPSAQQAFELMSTANGILTVKEWSEMLAPGLAADPFTQRVARLSRIYMGHTGMMPSPEKARQILGAPDPDAAAVEASKGLSGDDMPPVWNMFSGPAAKEAGARFTRPGSKWSRKDLDRLGRIMGTDETKAEADKARKLANTTIHGEEDSLTRQERIWEARGWYMPTSVKKRILARQASLVKQDGTFDDSNVKMFSISTGQNNGNPKDPWSFAHAVNTLGGKPRSQLNKKQKQQLDDMAEFLQDVYRPNGRDKGYVLKPGEKAVFDENMFRFASRYLLEASLPYVMSNHEVNGKPVVSAEQKAIAMVNISVATGGKVKPEDNIYQWLAEARMLGSADEMWSEKLSNYLFDSYSRTTGRGHSFEMQVSGFAALMGDDSVPRKYNGVDTRKVLGETRGQFANVYMAIDAQQQQQKTGVPNILTALSEGVLADIKVMNDFQSGKTIDPNKAKRWLDDPDSYSAKATAIPKQTVKRYGKAMQVKNPDPFDPVMRWIDETAVPTVGGIALGFMDGIERTKNQVFLTLALMGDSGKGAGFHLNTLAEIGELTGEDKKHPTRAVIAGTIDARIPVSVDAWSWHSIRNSWSAASEKVMAGGEYLKDKNDPYANRFEQMATTFKDDPSRFTFGNRAYMENQLKMYGLDPKEHQTLLFWTDMAWSLSLDLVLDKGFKFVSETLKESAQHVAMATLSPALKAEVKAARVALDTAKSARIADTAAFRTSYKALKDRAAVAERAGFSDIAVDLDEQAQRLIDDAKTTFTRHTAAQKKLSATVELLNRPKWYDPYAHGLSRGVQEPWQLERIMNIKTAGMEPDRVLEVKRITRIIADSTSEDTILVQMNKLRLLGVKLDGGKSWLGRTRNYSKWVDGDPMAAAKHIFPNEERIVNGAMKTDDMVESLGTMSNMGMVSTRRVEAQSRVNYYMKRLYAVEGLTQEAINYKKQQIWREFGDEIVDNMKNTPVSEEMVSQLEKWGRANGFDIAEIRIKLAAKEGMNNWDAYQMFRRVKQHKSINKSFGFGKEKNLPVYAVNENGVLSHEPELLPSVKEGGKKATGQLSKDLVAPFNMMDLVSFQRGRAGVEMWMHTGLAFGNGPSWMGLVNASKTIAIANMAFPISAFMIDEFWRFPVEYSRGNMTFNPIRYHQLRKALKASGNMREVGGDVITGLLGRSKELIPVGPTDPMYHTWLNAFNVMFEKNDFFQDFKNFLDEFPQMADESGEEFKARFYQHLTDRIMEESPEGDMLRLHMAQTHRGFDGPLVPGPELREQQAVYRETRDLLNDEMSGHVSKLHGDDGAGGLIGDKTAFMDQTLERTVPPKASKTLPYSEAQLEVFPDHTVTGKMNKDVYNAALRWQDNPTAANFNNLKATIAKDLQRKIDSVTKEVNGIRAALRDEAKPTDITFPKGGKALAATADANEALAVLRKSTAKMTDDGLAGAAGELDDVLKKTKDELKVLLDAEKKKVADIAEVSTPTPQYHGSRSVLEKLDPEHESTSLFALDTTDTPGHAGYYAKSKEGEGAVTELSGTPKKLFNGDASASGNKEFWDEVGKELGEDLDTGMTNHALWQYVARNFKDGDAAFRRVFEEGGYDAFRFTEDVPNVGKHTVTSWTKKAIEDGTVTLKSAKEDLAGEPSIKPRDIDIDPEKPLRIYRGIRSDIGSGTHAVDGDYYTIDKEYAAVYTRKGGGKSTAKDEVADGGAVTSRYVSDDAKILDVDKSSFDAIEYDNDPTPVFQWAKDNGYDIVYSSENSELFVINRSVLSESADDLADLNELITPKKNPFTGLYPEKSVPDGLVQVMDDFMSIPSIENFNSAKQQVLDFYSSKVMAVNKRLKAMETIEGAQGAETIDYGLQRKLLAAKEAFLDKFDEVDRLKYKERRVGVAKAPAPKTQAELKWSKVDGVHTLKHDGDTFTIVKERSKWHTKKNGKPMHNPGLGGKEDLREGWDVGFENLQWARDAVKNHIDELSTTPAPAVTRPKPLKPNPKIKALETKIGGMEQKIEQIKVLLGERAAKTAGPAVPAPQATGALDLVGQLPEGKVAVPKPKPNMSPAGVKKLQAAVRNLKKQLAALEDETLPVHDVIDYGPTTKTMKMRALLDVKKPTSKRWRADWFRSRHQSGLESYMSHVFDTAEGTRKATDDDIMQAFERMSKEQKETIEAQMFNDWKAETYELRGVTDYAAQRDAMDKAIDAEKSSMGRTKERLDEHLARREPTINLDTNSEEWLQRSVDRLFQWNGVDELWDAAVNGKTLTRKQVAEIQARLTAEGRTLPVVIGAANDNAGLWGSGTWWRNTGEYGRLPIINKLAEIGPYKVLDELSNATRRHAYIGRMMVELDELERLGFDKAADETLEMAHHRALDYTDDVMYSNGRTAMEQDTRGMFMFMPAYRQALQYWGRELGRNPFFYMGVRNKINTDYPSAAFGDYTSMVPMPFWAQGNIAEAAVPGLVPPLLYPLRVINTMSGWQEIEVQDAGGASHKEWEYTGNTKFDWMSEGSVVNLLTGFASKNISPLSFIDDFVYGIAGDNQFVMPTSAPNQAVSRLLSVGLALRKDPIARKKAAMNIYAAQVAKGMKPDITVAEAQIAGSPWWFNLLQKTGFITHPEGIFKAFTGTVLPRKITYSPADIGEIVYGPDDNREIKDIWGLLHDDQEARTIADAEWLYIKAITPAEKKAVLDKYPKYAKIVEFRTLDAYERAQYLAKPENRGAGSILPYVGSRNEYTPGGQLLLGDDYYSSLREGAIRKKDMFEFIGTLQKLNVNAQWDEIRLKIDKKREGDQKAALLLLKKAAREMSHTPSQYQSYLADILRYKNGWIDKTAPGEYEGGIKTPMTWMQAYAYKHNIYNKPCLWDLQAIESNYYDTLAEVGTDSTESSPEIVAALRKQGVRFPKTDNEKAKRPVGANVGGVESMYSNPRVKNWDMEHGVGGMNRIADSLTELMAPEDRALFDLRGSMSAHAIKEENKKNEEYRRYIILKYAGQEYWKYVNPAQLRSIGVPVENEKQMVGLMQKLDDLYELKAAKGAGLDTYSDEYKAVLKWYKKAYKQALSPKWAEPLREGPARRLMYTHLVQPGASAKVNMGYVSMALTQMHGGKPNWDYMMDSFRVDKHSGGDADKVASATAWTVVLGTSINYRNRMANTYNEWGDYNGVTPDSKAGEPYVNRLTRLVEEWKKRSRLFRRSWEDLGGDKMIPTFLDYGS